MHMKHPQPQFAHFVSRLRDLYPRLAYLHVVEPRMAGIDLRDVLAWETNDFLRAIWAPKMYISAGAYSRELAIKGAEEKGELIAVGRYFLSNVSGSLL